MGMTFDEFCDASNIVLTRDMFREFCVYAMKEDVVDCLLSKVYWDDLWIRFKNTLR